MFHITYYLYNEYYIYDKVLFYGNVQVKNCRDGLSANQNKKMIIFYYKTKLMSTAHASNITFYETFV